MPVWTKVKDITTDENGHVTLNKDSDGLSTNTCYRIVETGLGKNSNYALDTSKVYYFVWKGTVNGNTTPSNNDVWGSIKDNGILGDAVKNQTLFVTDSGTIYVPNKSTAVTVNKVWMDADKNEIANPGKTATVRLYRQTATPDGYKVTIHIHTTYDGYDPYTIYVKKDTNVRVKIYNYGDATYKGTTFYSTYSNDAGKNIATVDLGTITSDTNADISIGGGNKGGGYDTIYESADSYVYGEKEYIGADGSVVSEASRANIYLNSGNSYSNVWTGLEAADADGTEYSYHVEEDPISGFTTTYSDNNAAGIQTGALTVYNTQTETPKGSLWIEKTGEFNGEADTDGKLDGDYTFNVKDSENYVVKTVTVTLNKGVISAVSGDGTFEEGKAKVSDLPEGTYTVSEDLTGKDGISLLGSNDITVEVTADETAEVKTASFVNNKSSTKVKVAAQKTFTNGDLAQKTFTFSLQEYKDDKYYDTDKVGDAKKFITNENGKATSDDIEYSEVGTHYYKLTEVLPEGTNPTEADKQAGFIIVSGIKYDLHEHTIVDTVNDNGDGTLKVMRGVDGRKAAEYKEDTHTADATFTNEQLTTFTFNKVWNDGAQDIEWPKSGENYIPLGFTLTGTKDGQTISFTFNAKAGDTDVNLTLAEGTTVTTIPKASVTKAESENKYILTVTDLPAGYVYSVTESTKAAGYQVVYPEGKTNAAREETITNKETTFEFSKAWKKANGDDDSWKDGQKITVTLTGKAGEGENAPTVSSTYEITKTGEADPVANITEGNLPVPVYNSTSGKFEFTGLPYDDAGGNVYTYTLTEETVLGYQKPLYDNEAGKTSISDNGTITNTEFTFPFTKVWNNTNGSHTWPENTKLTFTVTGKKGETDTRTYTVTVTPGTENIDPVSITMNGAAAEGVSGELTTVNDEDNQPASYTITLKGLSSEYTYEVAENEDSVPTGYKMTKDGTTITNTQLKDFEFTKVWQAGGTDTTWKNDIEVTLKGTPLEGAPTEIDPIEAVYTIKQTSQTVDSQTTYSYEVIKKSGAELLPERGSYTGSGNNYTFKFVNLPAVYTYTLTEAQLSGYNAPKYSNPGDINKTDSITTGGTITNSTGYALPGTGGSGFNRYIGISVLVMLLAAILYINTRERRKKPS